jgi:pimeloyl-ACP methyl ester carboxylesterase
MQATFYSPGYVASHRGELAERAAQAALLPGWWFAGAADLLASLENLDLRRYLGSIACPVLVVAAGEDQVMPPGCARALVSAISGARLEMVEGSGHALIVERPREFANICLVFLEEIKDQGGPS